eukprot:Seg1823.12 transcript_id=Seg1823.12/GoldUCD/mRNA.D3Y31 product="Type-1 angiotensin II receptor-associated protein" protein_id=Seg1823.12/GoldUCD/D3Y31
MPLNLPAVPIKFLLIAHFVLVTWAALDLWLKECYIYSNYLVLIIGLWAMRDKNSIEPMQFLLGAHVFTILNDIILLGMWFPVADRVTTLATSIRPQFQFTAAMAILNLILKPFSALFMFKEYQDRGATGAPYEDLGAGGQPIPGKQDAPGSAPPSYVPPSSGGYMPPSSANAPYNQSSY